MSRVGSSIFLSPAEIDQFSDIISAHIAYFFEEVPREFYLADISQDEKLCYQEVHRLLKSQLSRVALHEAYFTIKERMRDLLKDPIEDDCLELVMKLRELLNGKKKFEKNINQVRSSFKQSAQKIFLAAPFINLIALQLFVDKLRLADKEKYIELDEALKKLLHGKEGQYRSAICSSEDEIGESDEVRKKLTESHDDLSEKEDDLRDFLRRNAQVAEFFHKNLKFIEVLSARFMFFLLSSILFRVKAIFSENHVNFLFFMLQGEPPVMVSEEKVEQKIEEEVGVGSEPNEKRGTWRIEEKARNIRRAFFAELPQNYDDLKEIMRETNNAIERQRKLYSFFDKNPEVADFFMRYEKDLAFLTSLGEIRYSRFFLPAENQATENSEPNQIFSSVGSVVSV